MTNSLEHLQQKLPPTLTKKRALSSLIECLNELRSISNTMTINQALAFLYVAHEDGIENLDVRRKTGFTHTTLSTLSNALASTDVDLITQMPSKTSDQRAKSLYLTEKGRKISEKLISKINNISG